MGCGQGMDRIRRRALARSPLRFESELLCTGTPMFNPGRYQSGTQWRLTHFGMSYASPRDFRREEFSDAEGRMAAAEGFHRAASLPPSLTTPSAVRRDFVTTCRGPRPLDMGGDGAGEANGIRLHQGRALYGISQATASGNHGLAFEGFAQDPSRNGLMTMVEAGSTPKPSGPRRFPGKYAVGGYYSGVRCSIVRWRHCGRRCLRFLFSSRPDALSQPSTGGESNEKSASGKSFKAPVEAATQSDQGLSMFNLLDFAPADTNLVSFSLQSGFVYKGLIPVATAIRRCVRSPTEATVPIASMSCRTPGLAARRISQPSWRRITGSSSTSGRMSSHTCSI